MSETTKRRSRKDLGRPDPRADLGRPETIANDAGTRRLWIAAMAERLHRIRMEARATAGPDPLSRSETDAEIRHKSETAAIKLERMRLALEDDERFNAAHSEFDRAWNELEAARRARRLAPRASTLSGEP